MILVPVVLMLIIMQVVPLGLMVDGPRGEEEATGIRIQVVVEEGPRTMAGDREQITIDLGPDLVMTVVIRINRALNSSSFRPNGGWTKRRGRSNQNSNSVGGREDAEQQETRKNGATFALVPGLVIVATK